VVRGKENASDHAPVWVELRDAAARRRSSVQKSKGATADVATRAGSKAQPVVKATKSAPHPLRRPRQAPVTKPVISDRPLLVIDGDSFAHRSYHVLPKTIQRGDGKGGGALVGFANFLLRLYQAERPRAVIVGWDTLEVATERHKQFPAYQSGREFDDALIDQLNVVPEFVAACGFANAKAPGFEADDFLAAAVAAQERRGGTALVASGDRDTFQLASDATTILYPLRAGEMARIGAVDAFRVRVRPDRP
jgi:hypothetical protein